MHSRLTKIIRKFCPLYNFEKYFRSHVTCENKETYKDSIWYFKKKLESDYICFFLAMKIESSNDKVSLDKEPTLPTSSSSGGNL